MTPTERLVAITDALDEAAIPFLVMGGHAVYITAYCINRSFVSPLAPERKNKLRADLRGLAMDTGDIKPLVA